VPAQKLVPFARHNPSGGGDTFAQVLAEAKEAKEAAFQAQWRQMKTGAQPAEGSGLARDCLSRLLQSRASWSLCAALETMRKRRTTGNGLPLRPAAARRNKDGIADWRCQYAQQTRCSLGRRRCYSAVGLRAGKNRPLDEDELDFVNAVERSKAAAERAWRDEQDREMDAFREVRAVQG